MAAARVTGVQGIHRAEKFAVLSVVENFNFDTIHIDFQVALNMANRAHSVTCQNDLEAADDFDLACRLWFALRDKQISSERYRNMKMGCLPMNCQPSIDN